MWCIAYRRPCSLRYTFCLPMTTSYVCALEPSYESTYQEVHKADFERLRGLVQTPEPRSFTHKGSDVGNPDPREGFTDGPMTHAPLLVAYIPWVRVHDFVKGEETHIVAKALHQTNMENLRSPDGITTPPSWGVFVTCNLISIVRVLMTLI